MMLYKFLFSVLETGDKETLFKVKDIYVAPKDQPILEFTKDFCANHNKLPDLSTVEDKFNITLTDNTETADYWYSEILSKYQEHIVEQAVVASAKNKSKAIDLFQQAIVDYNVDIGGKVHDYSDGSMRSKEYDKRKINGGITYLSTGAAELDTFSLGYKRADLWTIGGREGIGKSWYLLRMAEWLDQDLLDKGINKTVLIVSGEMGAEELAERLDAIRCELSYARLSKADLTKGQERKYKRYLSSFESNIKIVDSFDNLKDVQYYINIYRPAIVFIDGSHLLAKSYDWTEIARVTADMKKMTRNNKVPIVNTTHLKADKGKSASGGDMDDFA